MRIHLAERERWMGPRPVYINYALSNSGMVVQFEVLRAGYDYSLHFPLKQLLKDHFEGRCDWLIAEFAREMGVSVEALLIEALCHVR